MDMNTFLQRARQAQATPLVYWLGHGGWLATEQPSAGPGRPIDLQAELEKLQRTRPQVHAAYLQGMQAAGLTLAALPRVACDCSGYVCWALGVARNGSVLDGDWINTDAIVADANGRRRLFVPVDRAVPGVLLVHPKPGGGSTAPGHVAIVTEADAAGKPTRMLHCAPENIMIPPAPGGERSAIRETDTAHFDKVATSQLVVWKAFA